MKIAVCIKQVPTREWQPRLNDDKTWIREQDVSYEMNEPDAYALEESLRLREKHGGEVVVCSAGPARVQQVIREALARGADRALHVEDDALGAADAFAAAVGAGAGDGGAEVRPDPHRPAVRRSGPRAVRPGARREARHPALDDHHGSATCDGSALRVKRELEGGWFQYVSMPLPALLTIQSGINQLRYATLKGIMAAKKKEITKVAPAGAGGVAPEDRGALRAAEVEADRDDRRLARRSRQGAGQAAARGGARPMILVVAEQKDGKLNRASWEAIAAAQQLSRRRDAGEGRGGRAGRVRRRRASWPRPPSPR